MKPIIIIAINTYREIIRDRILYGIVVFAVLLIGLSLALGQLSFAEQSRITTSFGLSAIQLSAAILSIFLGSTLVAKEIEKKTIMTLLVRPVTRSQFLFGKALGLLFVQIVVISALNIILAIVYLSLGIPMQALMVTAVWGIFLEAMVLLGISLFFGIFASSTMVVAFSIGMFLIGHWIESLTFFGKKNITPAREFFVTLISHGLPNLEHFNWRSAVIYGDSVSSAEILSASGYGFGWFLVFLTMAAIVFQRRDFG